MKSKNDRYEVCDFCHKPHKASELEKVVITYKKCKHCSTEQISLGDSIKSVSSEKMPITNNAIGRATTATPPRLPQVPPYLASAFGAPDEFELGKPKASAMSLRPKTNPKKQ